MELWLRDTLNQELPAQAPRRSLLPPSVRRMVQKDLVSSWRARRRLRPDDPEPEGALHLPRDAVEFARQRRARWALSTSEELLLRAAAHQDLPVEPASSFEDAKDSEATAPCTEPHRPSVLVLSGPPHQLALRFHAGVADALASPSAPVQAWWQAEAVPMQLPGTSQARAFCDWGELTRWVLERSEHVLVSYAGPQRLPPLRIETLPCVDPAELRSHWEWASALWGAHSAQRRLCVSVASVFHGRYTDFGEDVATRVKKRLGPLFGSTRATSYSDAELLLAERWGRAVAKAVIRGAKEV